LGVSLVIRTTLPLYTMFRVSLIFSLLLALALPLLAADPSEQFLSAYESYQQAEGLERSGNTSAAINKYHFAESLLLGISKKDPSWQKPVVEYRLKKTRENLDRLQGVGMDSGGADATLTTPPPSQEIADRALPKESPTRAEPSVSVGPSISITPPTSASPKAVRANTPTPATSSETRRLRQMVEDLKGQLQEANDVLASQRDRANDLENAEWVKKRSELTGELDVAKRRISDLERDLKTRDSWGQDLKNLQKKLDDAVADKLATEEQLQGNVKRLGDANALLAKQLQEAQSKVVETSHSKEKIEALTKEVEQGKEAYTQLQAKFDHSEQISREALARNDDLKRQLTETAEKQLIAQKQAEIAAPLQARIKELQAKLDHESGAARREASLQADVQVLEEDRDRLMQKVTALGAAAADASKVKGLSAETEMLKKTVADLKGKLDASNQELSTTREQTSAAQKVANQEQKMQLKNRAEAEADRAVLQEEKDRLVAKVTQAAAMLVSLKSTAQRVPSLQKDLDQLKIRLNENSKTLDQSSAKLAEAKKAEAAARDEVQKKEADAKSVADLMAQQNQSLQEQLKAALSKASSTVDHASESAALQEQVKKLQSQVESNAQKFAESQRQLTELAKSQPDQQKALEEKQKALTEAQSKAASLQTKLADAGTQIETLKKQGDQGQTRLKELQNQLTERDAKIAQLKKKKGNAADDQMAQENELLRGIVLREIKDEAKKSQAHRLMQEELKRLNIQSDTLQQQMSNLAAPAVELTPQERALFKDAQLVVSDQGGESVEASISAPMSGSNAETTNVATSTNSPASNKATETNAQATLPWQGKFKELLSQAKEQFERQDYLQAEDTFQQALKLSPTDFFALSNYGVVEFQLGKMKEAEEALKIAADQSGTNSFALTTLGIVHYRQKRPQDAENVLRKAVAIDDKDFTAHNYLGIVLAASGKGKAGESELMKAVELNPNYADAHFNLAVIYATGKPPSKMLARKHYQKALELGSPPDASLDRILQ
jgi:Flp pilus assembly protein TadD